MLSACLPHLKCCLPSLAAGGGAAAAGGRLPWESPHPRPRLRPGLAADTSDGSSPDLGVGGIRLKVSGSRSDSGPEAAASLWSPSHAASSSNAMNPSRYSSLPLCIVA